MGESLDERDASSKDAFEKGSGQIDYEELCRELSKVPRFDVPFEEVSILFVGMPMARVEKVYTCELAISEKDERSVNALKLQRIDGGTWIDYLKYCSGKFETWLKFASYNRAQRRIMIVDSSNPLSVLSLHSPEIEKNTIVFAITADEESTPVEQNTSYAALHEANRRGLSLILAKNSHLKRTSYFSGELGLIMGPLVLGRLAISILDMVGRLSDFIERDARLGVNAHSFSTLTVASQMVYKSVDDALVVQSHHNSMNVQPDEVLTTCLLAHSPKQLHVELSNAFKRFYRSFPNLLSVEECYEEKASRHNTYDLLVLYGLRDSGVQDSLRKGYEAVTRMDPRLRLEGLH